MLKALHFYRLSQKQKQEIESHQLQLAAYFNLVAMSHLMSEGQKTFEDVFPAPKQPVKILKPEDRQAEFAKHNMVLVK